jgi:aspartyl-tRNA(Asn)/glutamyl-tRNA(Gln) amidotransferase subunit C
MAISRDDVAGIAELAKLQFSEEEIEAFTPQFRRILNYVEKLQEVSVEGVEATTHVGRQSRSDAEGRADETGRSFAVETALANAPDPGAGHFRVPKVI